MYSSGKVTRPILVGLIILLGLLSKSTEGQDPSDSAVFIKAGHVLDVRSGKVADDQGVLIEGGLIKEVGSEIVVAQHLPKDTRVIDLSELTLLPGLIDCHEHILGNPHDWSRTAALRMSSAQAALWGVRNLRVWLAEGFTTLRDAGEDDPWYGQIALRDSVGLGLIEGPRIVSAGGFISIRTKHFLNIQTLPIPLTKLLLL
jgi:imidazolonepropionase-like amidohydrolase